MTDSRATPFQTNPVNLERQGIALGRRRPHQAQAAIPLGYAGGDACSILVNHFPGQGASAEAQKGSAASRRHSEIAAF
jgi:hypothetical protein